LIWAIIKNKYPIFKLLIKAKVIDINKSTRYGKTHLYFSVVSKNEQIIKDILKKGINNQSIQVSNIFWKNPLEKALKIKKNNINSLSNYIIESLKSEFKKFE